MMNITLSIIDPSSNRFKSIKAWSGKTFIAHKYWEVQVMQSTDIVALDFRVTTRQDHAGADLWLGLFGYAVNFTFYDNRHWNYETDQYCSEEDTLR